MESINLEEVDEQKQRQECCLYEEREVSIGSDWVKQFLDMSDEELFEVVTSTEVNKPNGDEEEDDDCVILEGDPEKKVMLVNDSPNGSDELLVVGEKGQIACRDYPHPRHLCATFPYDSTPHDRYCAQCHCYVCDSPAPCLKWGNGLLTTDHCHATDKSATWKILRKESNLVKTDPLPASTNNATLGDLVNSQDTHILPYDIKRLSVNSMSVNLKSRAMALRMRPVNLTLQNQTSRPSLINLTPQNQTSRPRPASQQITVNAINAFARSNETHPLSENLVPQNAFSSLTSRLQNQISTSNNVLGHSTGSSFAVPNGANDGSYHEPGSPLVTNKYPSHAASRMSLGVRSHVIQKKSGHRIGIGNTPATNSVTPLDASGLINRVNPQHGDTNHAAVTGFSNTGNCYAENNDILIAQAIDLLLTQPNHSPAYETQPCNQSNNSQNADGYYDIWANDHVARLNKNEHQIGSENKTVINRGATVQNVFQHKPEGGIENEDFLAKDSNTNGNISYVENLVSKDKESNTPFSGNTHLSLDEIKHWLLDSN
ncbi:hypothetical protein RYX36_031400 [Vicia faba]